MYESYLSAKQASIAAPVRIVLTVELSQRIFLRAHHAQRALAHGTSVEWRELRVGRIVNARSTAVRHVEKAVNANLKRLALANNECSYV